AVCGYRVFPIGPLLPLLQRFRRAPTWMAHRRTCKRSGATRARREPGSDRRMGLRHGGPPPAGSWAPGGAVSWPEGSTEGVHYRSRGASHLRRSERSRCEAHRGPHHPRIRCFEQRPAHSQSGKVRTRNRPGAMNISSDKFVRSPGASQVPGSGSRLSRSTAAIVLWLEAAVVPALFGQTLVQLTDLGSNIGPRLTRAVAQARISRSLFVRIGTKVNFIIFGTVYQFAGDPDWSRLLVGLKDQWIHEYRNDAGPGGRIQDPGGIDISARKNFYTADQAKARLFAAVFDPNAQNL